jgi:regulator of sirC expression with transglutaminase-like and TPR domain
VTSHPGALQRFRAVVAGSEPLLAEACTLMAQHLGQRPGVAVVASELDALAVAVAANVGPRPDLAAISRCLRATFGFRGNRADYGDPRNSLLPVVLDRRLGIPLTLAIVHAEVATRLGVPASIVGMPGHVLLGDGPHPGRWIDPFDPAGWLDVAGAERAFRAVHGSGPRFDQRLLAASPARLVVVRATENLIGAHQRRGEPWGALRSLELRAQIPGFGEAPSARIQLAEAYATVGRWADAATELEHAADALRDDRRDAVLARARQLRSSAN